jgi:hypothetical protein
MEWGDAMGRNTMDGSFRSSFYSERAKAPSMVHRSAAAAALPCRQNVLAIQPLQRILYRWLDRQRSTKLERPGSIVKLPVLPVSIVLQIAKRCFSWSFVHKYLKNNTLRFRYISTIPRHRLGEVAHICGGDVTSGETGLGTRFVGEGCR